MVETTLNLIAFDRYFSDYTHYDRGGRIDKAVVAQAKEIYEEYKSLDNLTDLRDRCKELMNSLSISEDIGYKYQSILCALNYAQYYNKWIYLSKELNQYKYPAVTQQPMPQKKKSLLYKVFKH